MVFSLSTFVRQTSPALIHAYLRANAIDQGHRIDWEAKVKERVAALQALLDELPADRLACVRADFEAVDGLGDETGRQAVFVAATGAERTPVDFSGACSAHDRALTLLLADTLAFKRAQEIQFSSDRYGGRSWNGYRGPQVPVIDPNRIALDEFGAELASLYRRHNGSGRTVEVEWFERTPGGDRGAGDEKSTPRLFQASIYLEALPDALPVFDGAGVARQVIRPAIEAALTYEPATGKIDVMAVGGRSVRRDIAEAFCRVVLGHEAELDSVVLREFNLESLRTSRPFPTDAGDGIRSVRVVRLRLGLGTEANARLTLDVGRDGTRTLHDVVKTRLGPGNPLAQGAPILHAKLAVVFDDPNSRRGHRVLNVEITKPNGCNLKDRVERERLIGEKYLERWGLLARA